MRIAWCGCRKPDLRLSRCAPRLRPYGAGCVGRPGARRDATPAASRIASRRPAFASRTSACCMPRWRAHGTPGRPASHGLREPKAAVAPKSLRLEDPPNREDAMSRGPVGQAVAPRGRAIWRVYELSGATPWRADRSEYARSTMLSDAELQSHRNINTGRGPSPQPDDPFWERLEARGLVTRQQVRRGDGAIAAQGALAAHAARAGDRLAGHVAPSLARMIGVCKFEVYADAAG
jgi:hypothetical protein